MLRDVELHHFLKERITLQEGEEDRGLNEVIEAIASASQKISIALRTEVIRKSGTGTNKFGDDVLSVDLLADDTISASLASCCYTAAFCSEEKPDLTVTPHAATPTGKYCVAFDPLDGSSIIPTNFAVGSIFGIWRGKQFIGQRVADIVSSVVVVYGPRTVLFLAHRAVGTVEFLLDTDGQWYKVDVATQRLKLSSKAKIFAPGNLRAVRVIPWYRMMVQEYMLNNITLRYTGGMVPDVCQLLIKGSGIFMTPESPDHKVKLRVLFECGPMAFLIHCAGGYATTGTQDYMQLVIRELHQRSPIALGSADDVKRYECLCTAATLARETSFNCCHL